MSRSRQTLITQFLPKRSQRLIQKSKIIEDEKEKEKYIGTGTDPPGFKVKKFKGKGRGVVSTKSIEKGSFICEYNGNLIKSTKEAKKLIEIYDENQLGSYIYYFKWKNKSYCIDATSEENKSLGRLINHSRKQPNCKTQVFEKEGTPHLIFIALKNISPGEELLYDYGETDKKTIESNPWLANS